MNNSVEDTPTYNDMPDLSSFKHLVDKISAVSVQKCVFDDGKDASEFNGTIIYRSHSVVDPHFCDKRIQKVTQAFRYINQQYERWHINPDFSLGDVLTHLYSSTALVSIGTERTHGST